MKIIHLDIEGFRSLRSQSWRPGNLNLLIGPNASGKSNLLCVLDFLSAAARGRLARFVQREGGMEPLAWDGKADRVVVRAKMTPLPPYTDAAAHAMTYELALGRLGRGGGYVVENEYLANTQKVESGEATDPECLLVRNPQHGATVYSIDQQKFQAHPASISPDEAFLSVAPGPFSANRFVDGFQSELARWKIHTYFRTDQDAPIRAAQVACADTEIDADGQNLVAVLHSLYTSNRQFEDEINTAMRSAFGDDYEKLVFPPAADQRIQMRIRWRSLSREQSAADLSDGTLRFLFLLAVLANPAPPPLVAIDEPDVGLHPSMLPIVAEYAREAATRSQVILTTHSPEFLDAFAPTAPTTTVVERHEGETVLRTVAEDELAYWLKQYSLGELFRSRELEAMG